MPKLNPYTVILLYPEYCASNFGEEIYMSTVQAEDPRGALAKARIECVVANAPSKVVDEPNDLFCIAVIEGEHADVQPFDD